MRALIIVALALAAAGWSTAGHPAAFAFAGTSEAEAADDTAHLSADAQAEFDKAVQAGQSGNLSTAFSIFKRLAESGMPDAQAVLGLMYRDGKGTPQDKVQAGKWLRIAFARGADVAEPLMFLRNGMTDAEITQANRLADQWLAAHPQQR